MSNQTGPTQQSQNQAEKKRELTDVAAELAEALAAQEKIPALQKELLSLSGKRRRSTSVEEKE